MRVRPTPAAGPAVMQKSNTAAAAPPLPPSHAVKTTATPEVAGVPTAAAAGGLTVEAASVAKPLETVPKPAESAAKLADSPLKAAVPVLPNDEDYPMYDVDDPARWAVDDELPTPPPMLEFPSTPPPPSPIEVQSAVEVVPPAPAPAPTPTPDTIPRVGRHSLRRLVGELPPPPPAGSIRRRVPLGSSASPNCKRSANEEEADKGESRARARPRTDLDGPAGTGNDDEDPNIIQPDSEAMIALEKEIARLRKHREELAQRFSTLARTPFPPPPFPPPPSTPERNVSPPKVPDAPLSPSIYTAPPISTPVSPLPVSPAVPAPAPSHPPILRVYGQSSPRGATNPSLKRAALPSAASGHFSNTAWSISMRPQLSTASARVTLCPSTHPSVRPSARPSARPFAQVQGSTPATSQIPYLASNTTNSPERPSAPASIQPVVPASVPISLMPLPFLNRPPAHSLSAPALGSGRASSSLLRTMPGPPVVNFDNLTTREALQTLRDEHTPPLAELNFLYQTATALCFPLQ